MSWSASVSNVARRDAVANAVAILQQALRGRVSPTPSDDVLARLDEAVTYTNEHFSGDRDTYHGHMPAREFWAALPALIAEVRRGRISPVPPDPNTTVWRDINLVLIAIRQYAQLEISGERLSEVLGVNRADVSFLSPLQGTLGAPTQEPTP